MAAPTEPARDLFRALQAGDAARATALLSADPELARATAPSEWAPDGGIADVDGRSTVQAAIESGLEDVALALLDAGADPRHRSSNGRSAAHDAFEFGAPRVSERLRALGCEDDAALAAGNGDLARLDELLAADPAVAEDGTTGLAPMGWASYGDQPAAIDRLVAAGAAVEDAYLAMAASCGHAGAIRALLRHGADPNAPVSSGRARPLHVAAAMRYSTCTAEAARALLEGGADVDAVDAEGRAPLDVLADVGARSAAAASADERERHVAELRAVLVQAGARPGSGEGRA